MKVTMFLMFGVSLFVLCGFYSCVDSSQEKEIGWYHSVQSERLDDLSKRISRVAIRGESPLFVVENGALYLLVRIDYNYKGLTMRLEKIPWDIEKLQKLRTKNPSITGFFPDQHADDGGIIWFKTNGK